MSLVLGQSVSVTDVSGLTTIDLPAIDTDRDSLVLLFVILNGNIQVSSITDTAGLAWAPRVLVDQGGLLDMEEWVAYTSSLPVLANVITINFSGTASLVTAMAVSISGGDVSNPFDLVSPVSGLSMPLTVNTNTANTMVIGAYRQSMTAAPTAGSGFIQIVGSDYLGVEYSIYDSVQSNLLVDETDGSSDIAAGIVDVIRAVADAAPAVDMSAIPKIPLTGNIQFILADFETDNPPIVEFSMDDDGVVLEEGSTYIYETDFGDPTLRYRVRAVRPTISGDLVTFILKDAETIF